MISFNRFFGSPRTNGRLKLKNREAVRAVIIRETDNKILLIHSKKGDYKFPGGGVEKDETHMEALLREIAEETGYINCLVKEKIGVVIEGQQDKYERNTYFQMNSHYYICELINEESVPQKLDGYEKEEQFTPKWISLSEAIEINENAMLQTKKHGWITRENFVLRELKKYYGSH